MNIQDNINIQFLIRAATHGHTEEVRRLITLTDPKNESSRALSHAASYGHAHCVKLLIPVSEPTVNDSQALQWASANMHTDCVDLLFDVSNRHRALHRLQKDYPNYPIKWQYLEEKIVTQRQRDMLDNEIAQQTVQSSMKKARKI